MAYFLARKMNFVYVSVFLTRQQAMGTNEYFPPFHRFRDETLRAYQAIALRLISFFTRIACGAHGLMSTNELVCFILVFFEN